MQSGSPLGNWAIYREPAKQAKRFAAKFNCSVTDTEEMVACLKKVDVFTLAEAHKEILVHKLSFSFWKINCKLLRIE